MAVVQPDEPFEGLSKTYQELKGRVEAGKKLKGMTDEEFSTFSEEILELCEKADKLLDNYEVNRKSMPENFKELLIKMDNFYSSMVRERKRRNIFLRAYYAIIGAPTPKLQARSLLLGAKELFDQKFKDEMDKINSTWEEKIQKTFKAPPGTGVLTQAGIEGRRWGTTYLLTTEQAEELVRKKEAYDRVQATLSTCKTLGLRGRKAQEATKYIIKATASTVQALAEESVVTTGQAVMVGLGGPIYAGLVLAWNATFGILEKGGNFISRGFATADAFMERGIMRLFGEVAKKENGYIDWTKGNALKNIGFGALHSLRAPFFLPKILFSGVGAFARAIEQGVGKFAKKNIIPLLGVSGTVIATYFIAITLTSVFTLGIPLAVTAVGLAFAFVGAAMATYMRTKSKAQELISLKLSPEEEMMLMRYEYQHKVDRRIEVSKNFQQPHTGLEGQALAVRREAQKQYEVKQRSEEIEPTAGPFIISAGAQDKGQSNAQGERIEARETDSQRNNASDSRRFDSGVNQ